MEETDFQGPRTYRRIPLPISRNIWLRLEGRFPMTEEAWTQMLRILDAMKLGLVAEATVAVPESLDSQ